MEKQGDIPSASEEILRHPYVKYLHRVIEDLVKRVEVLENENVELQAEIASLKKVPKKPKIKPSGLDEEKEEKGKSKDGKRAGVKSGRRKKIYQ